MKLTLKFQVYLTDKNKDGTKELQSFNDCQPLAIGLFLSVPRAGQIVWNTMDGIIIFRILL